MAKKKTKQKPVCLLILGMHRSGTSAITRVLSIAGAKMPAMLMSASEGNRTGHWESTALYQYHDVMLGEMGSSWNDWRALPVQRLTIRRRNEIKTEIGDMVAAEFGDAPLFAIKDPRICRFAPLFIDALHEAGIEPYTILTFRNPLEVCKSLEERDGMNRGDAALLWLRHVLDAEAATRDSNRVIVTYNLLLNDWKAVFDKINRQFELKDIYSKDDIAPQVEDFLSANLRHHAHKTEEVLLDPLLGDWVGAAYHALLVLARNPNSQKAKDQLDSISSEFNRSNLVLHRLNHAVRAEQKEKIESVKSSLSEAENKAIELTQNLQDKETEADTLRARLSESEEYAEELKRQVDQATEIQTELSALKEETSQIKMQLSAAEDKALGLEERLLQKEGEASQLEDRLLQKEGEASQLEATLAQRGTDILEMKKELSEQETHAANLLAQEKEKAAGALRAEQVELQRVRDQLVTKNSEISSTKVQLSKATRRIQTIENMTSWKLTWPLRRLKSRYKMVKAGLLKSGQAPKLPTKLLASTEPIRPPVAAIPPAVSGKKNILLVGHSSGESLFGAEISLIGIAQSVDRSKYHTHVVFPRHNQKYFDMIKDSVDSISVFPYSWRSSSGPSSEDCASFTKIFREKNIDLIHVNTSALQSPLVAARQCGIKSIVHIREIITLDPHLCLVFGQNADEVITSLSEEADLLITNSKATSTFNGLMEDGHVLYNEVDTDLLDFPNKINNKKISVGIISSNVPKKGIKDFVELARCAEKRIPNMVFRVIGPENKFIQTLTSDASDLPGNLEFVGYQETPAAAISKVNIVLSMSSFMESFGRTVAEAMAAQRPVIAYEWGAVPELIRHGTDGYLIPYRQYEAALPYLEDLAKNPKNIKIMGKHGRERAVSLFSRKVFAEGLNSIYAKALALPPAISSRSQPEKKTLIERPEKKQVIAYFIWHFPAPSETFVLNELRHLVRSGHDVRVFCRQSPYPDFSPDFPIRYQRVQSLDDFMQRLIDEKCTIVHSHFTYPTVTDFVWPACEKTGIDFTFIAHAQDIFRYENDAKNRIGEVCRSARCKRVFVPGKFHREYLMERGVPADKIVVNPQGIDITRYSAGAAPDRHHRPLRKICNIQRFVEKKGIEYLIRAAKHLSADGIVVDIYGYGPLEQEYADLIKAEGITNVFLRGPVKGIDELLTVFREHDLLVSPCVRASDGDMDGIPTILMEAMAAGLPVITTPISSIPDLVKDGVTGIYCQENDVDSIVSSVRSYYGLPSARVTALIENARAHVDRQFSTSVLQRNLLRIWNDKTVDIVIVSWNNLPELKEVIDRLFVHTSSPFNLTVVDNASNDSQVIDYLRELEASKDNVTVVFQAKNTYVGPGTNAALELCRSDFCIYVCGKEGFALQNGWELAMVNYMEEHPDVGLAGTLGYSPSYLTGQGYVDGISRFNRFRNQQFAKDNSDRVFRHVQGGLFIVRVAMYKEIGGFSTSVPHDHTDVEYSYYVESKGWKLGEIPAIRSLYHKSLPSLISRIDEKILAVHPGSFEIAQLLDNVASQSVRYCIICGWQGDRFNGGDGAEECANCASTPGDRTLFRYLAESTLTYRRLKGVCVNPTPSLEPVWREQFQGSIFGRDEFIDIVQKSHIQHGDNCLDIAYLNDTLSDNPGRNNQILAEIHRVLRHSGVLLIRNQYDCPDGPTPSPSYDTLLTTLDQAGFGLAGEKLFASTVVRFDWLKLLVCHKKG